MEFKVIEVKNVWKLFLILVLGFAMSFTSLEVNAQPVSQKTPTQTKNPEPPDHPLAPALKIARTSRGVMAKIKDYEAIFTKREMIRGRLMQQQTQIRFRQQPFSVYMKFLRPNAGREILYIHGQNNNQLMAHEGSGISALVGTVSLATNGSEALKENRYPITMIGISNMLELIIKQWETESQFGEINVQYYPEASIGKVKCQVIEVTHPRPRRQFKFQKTRLYIDKETNVPIRVENYSFPTQPGQQSPLAEEYTYTNIRTNIGLSEIDFSRKNPKYKF